MILGPSLLTKDFITAIGISYDEVDASRIETVYFKNEIMYRSAVNAK